MITVSIVGGSGYVGGEALRLLVDHPHVEVQQVTSERNNGTLIKFIHPNLRGKTNLKFCSIKELNPCDVLFVALPHGTSAKYMPELVKKADYVIDKGSDFRLQDTSLYKTYYDWNHPQIDLLKQFIYGIPELHRDQLKNAKYAAAAGCNATATILALYPLYKAGVVDKEKTVVEVKAGSSQGGASFTLGSHHPERSNCVRSYAPTGHRHVAEITQELGSSVHFSATALDLVRGILCTGHVFLTTNLDEKEILKLYRTTYQDDYFIRVVADKTGIYRRPEPKLLWGTNYCDISIAKDPHSNRVVVMSAIDNLMKGAAGQAVQCMNLMCGLEESAGLGFSGLHPV